jgi:hypothetical protein
MECSRTALAFSLAGSKISVIKTCSSPSTTRPYAQGAGAIRTAQDMFSDSETEQEFSNFSAGVELYII